ncbi:hypothetical protein [Natronobacterium texcoconense]|uniref:Uncharacterized protein n=1 Tax=Natronobacterium texcoconense TaxID=1095778 RepID=A0A1H1GS85_NATTX|nr:hypothetical protein [Natronobacterium texcoconense]SDR15716.1 hypothetical protein SAMN04489842_2562 [Natronobacterium texcoconense]
MGLQRRTFLMTSGVMVSGSLGGCVAGLSEPDLTIVDLTATEVRVVSGSEEDDSFSVTAQNTGVAGDIEITLYWQMTENADPEDIGSVQSIGWQREQQKVLYFDADERREVEFTATPPAAAVGYYFELHSRTAGAKIRNDGGAGEARVAMEYEHPAGLPDREETTVFFQEDEVKEVTFDVRMAEDSEYEVIAEPAE